MNRLQMFLVVVCVSTFCVPAFAQEQVDIDREVRLSRIAEIANLNATFHQLLEPDYLRTMEITDQQLEELKKLRNVIDLHLSQVMNPENVDPDLEVMTQRWLAASSAIKSARAIMNETLLPHQKQAYYQFTTLRKLGFDQPDAEFGHEQLASMLELNDEQKKSIRDIEERFKSELKKANATLKSDIKEILEESQGAAIAELTAEQRRKYDELLGEPLPSPWRHFN